MKGGKFIYYRSGHQVNLDTVSIKLVMRKTALELTRFTILENSIATMLCILPKTGPGDKTTVYILQCYLKLQDTVINLMVPECTYRIACVYILLVIV